MSSAHTPVTVSFVCISLRKHRSVSEGVSRSRASRSLRLACVLALGGLLLPLLALLGPAQAISSGHSSAPATRLEMLGYPNAPATPRNNHSVTGHVLAITAPTTWLYPADGEGRHAQRPALVGQRQRHQLGRGDEQNDDLSPGWAWSRGGARRLRGGLRATSYVERVISHEIVISEDKPRPGRFHSAQARQGARTWPTASSTSSTRRSTEHRPAEGLRQAAGRRPLTAMSGAWKPRADVALPVARQRCADRGGDQGDVRPAPRSAAAPSPSG